MTEPPRDDDDDDIRLAMLLREARAGQEDLLPDPLFARIMADATDLDRNRHSAPRAGFWALLGGWPSVAGLAMAGLAGLWIGAAQPDLAVFDPAAMSYDLGDLMPGFDVLAGEG